MRRKAMRTATLKLKDLDCAHCADKIETAVNKIQGVKANVSFMTQKMSVEISDGEIEEVLKEIKKVVSKIEPDVTVSLS